MELGVDLLQWCKKYFETLMLKETTQVKVKKKTSDFETTQLKIFKSDQYKNGRKKL